MGSDPMRHWSHEMLAAALWAARSDPEPRSAEQTAHLEALRSEKHRRILALRGKCFRGRYSGLGLARVDRFLDRMAAFDASKEKERAHHIALAEAVRGLGLLAEQMTTRLKVTTARGGLRREEIVAWRAAFDGYQVTTKGILSALPRTAPEVEAAREAFERLEKLITLLERQARTWPNARGGSA
jgi:hypothetical protein